MTAESTAVTVRARWDGRTMPALVEAARSETDLAGWLRQEKDQFDSLAYRAGAVLLRGFAVDTAAEFRAAMDALSSNILDYGERSSPRTAVSPGVYTSTEYAAEERIQPHNEQSYTTNWPVRITFFCEQPATSGGRTPLTDSRRVLARLGVRTVERFDRLGVRYVRNYLPGISLSWQEAFQTQRRDDVERYCAAADITTTWVGSDHLRTEQLRPAIRRHPVTGERSWFNHAVFFHISSLPEEVSAGLLAALPEEDLPYNTYYGDGTAIEPETLAGIRAAMDAETTSFEWHRGDVLVVENMLTAHAREPFDGPRRVLVAMSDPIAQFGVLQ